MVCGVRDKKIQKIHASEGFPCENGEGHEFQTRNQDTATRFLDCLNDHVRSVSIGFRPAVEGFSTLMRSALQVESGVFSSMGKKIGGKLAAGIGASLGARVAVLIRKPQMPLVQGVLS